MKAADPRRYVFATSCSYARKGTTTVVNPIIRNRRQTRLARRRGKTQHATNSGRGSLSQTRTREIVTRVWKMATRRDDNCLARARAPSAFKSQQGSKTHEPTQRLVYGNFRRAGAHFPPGCARTAKFIAGAFRAARSCAPGEARLPWTRGIRRRAGVIAGAIRSGENYIRLLTLAQLHLRT